MTTMPLLTFLERSARQAERLDILSCLEGPDKSTQTLKTYRRIWARTGFSPDPLAGVTRKSFKVHRAAMLYCCASAFSDSWKELNELRKTGADRADRELVLRLRVAKSLEQYDRVRSAEKPPAEGGERASKAIRNRADWRSDWQAEAYTRVPEAARLAVALLWAMPLRPAELHRGVKIEILEGGDVRVTAPGAKVSEITGGGQEWRVITLDRSSPPTRLVRFELEKAGVSTMRYARNLHTLRHDLEDAGRAMGMEGRLCAYCFRHAAAGDLKADRDQELVALAMGHVSAKSQTGYGHASRGKAGRSAILSVEAPEAVRHLDKIRWSNAAIKPGMAAK